MSDSIGRTSRGVLPPHVIIVEGPDGAGKTTLARKLAEDLHLDYHHEGPPPPGVSALEHYTQLIVRTPEPGRVVFDRLALGELVYGPILRGEDRLGEPGWQSFCRVLAAIGARHVVCLPPPSTSHAVWRANLPQELFSGDARYFQTYSAFAYLAKTFGLRTYDYTRERYEDLLAEVSLRGKGVA